jgi:phosphoribosylpyrophosphate synthetase
MIAHAAEQFGFDKYVVVAPDEGAQRRFGVPGLEKQRLDSFSFQMSGELDVDEKDVIVIDDITKSGGTLLRAGEILKSNGAKKVGYVVLHIMPVRVGGEDLLGKLISESEGRIVTSNSVYTRAFCKEHPNLVYDMVDALVEGLS